MDTGFVRAAAAVPEVSVGGLLKNTETLLAQIQEAAQNGVQVVAFPELCITSYTLGDLLRQPAVIEGSERMLKTLMQETASLDIFCVVGLPVLKEGRLYNCAAAFCRGVLLGVVPKAYLPNYSEFYEQRWFSSGLHIKDENVLLASQTAPFGTDILFDCESIKDLSIGIEVCADMWVPFPQHAYQAVSGATLLINISSSSELVGKKAFREDMLRQQSARCVAAMLYTSAGPGESTTDSVYGGHAALAENGELLGSFQEYSFESRMAVTEFDLDRIRHDRLLLNRLWDGERKIFRRAVFALEGETDIRFRQIESNPFVPENSAKSYHICKQAFSIQTIALARRTAHVKAKSLVIGVSGGLDSALALMTSVYAAGLIGMKSEAVLGVVMPGLGSTETTQNLAQDLVKAVGASLRVIPISEAVKGHLKDIGHDFCADITFENAQARERTQILMDLANKENGIVIGTGDLSELALGFCTYNGDQMSMYGVNAGLPKTLIREMALRLSPELGGEKLERIIKHIVSIPPSPELLPPSASGGERQDTEKQIGPYEINDFFVYYMLRYQMTPRKLYTLARAAFKDKFDEAALKQQLKTFYRRFFAAQYKRSAAPDGPKILEIGLSPRGDWRMPSDADPELWLKDIEALS